MAIISISTLIPMPNTMFILENPKSIAPNYVVSYAINITAPAAPMEQTKPLSYQGCAQIGKAG
jgi:hypothetical protein